MNKKATGSGTLKKRPLEIVIIDDDPLVCLIQKTKIRSRFSQPLHEFVDPAKALDFISEATGTDFLVLLDIDMPAMDGWQVLSELQKAGAGTNIKVIMLSCSISTADKVRASKFAVVLAYFEKPLYSWHLEEMDKLIQSIYTS